MKETTTLEQRNLLELNIKLFKEYESIVCRTNLKIQYLQNNIFTMYVELELYNITLKVRLGFYLQKDHLLQNIHINCSEQGKIPY